MNSDVGDSLSSSAPTVPTVLRRDVIVASGTASATFLHGQLSQDVTGMAAGSHSWALHLQPNGRVIALVGLYRVSTDAFVLHCDPGAGDAVHNGLKRFLIRTACTLSLVTDVGVGAILGSDPEAAVDPSFVACFPWPMWLNRQDIQAAEDSSHVEGVSQPDSTDLSVSFHNWRIRHGLVCFGQDYTDSSLPAETGVIPAAVAFGKGCYVGQELVERIDSRGRTVRRLVRVQPVNQHAPTPQVGTAILASDGHEVGVVTSVTDPTESPWRAFANVRSDAVEIFLQDHSQLVVRELL